MELEQIRGMKLEQVQGLGEREVLLYIACKLHDIAHVLARVDRRERKMAGVLEGVELDEQQLSQVSGQLLGAVNEVAQRLEQLANQTTVDPAEVAALHQKLQGDLSQVQDALDSARSAAAGGATGATGATGAPDEGATGATGAPEGEGATGATGAPE